MSADTSALGQPGGPPEAEHEHPAGKLNGLSSRLTAEKKAPERDHGGMPKDKKEILKARAKALAREVAKEEAAEGRIGIVEFLLAGERYGFASTYVYEVYPLENLARVPCTPAFVLGIINVRGRILSVIDLRKFFSLPEKKLTHLNKVIIIKSDEKEFGVLADEVLGVHPLALNEIQPSLPTLTEVRGEYLKGVTKEKAALFDADKLLSDKKLVVYEEG